MDVELSCQIRLVPTRTIQFSSGVINLPPVQPTTKELNWAMKIRCDSVTALTAPIYCEVTFKQLEKRCQTLVTKPQLTRKFHLYSILQSYMFCGTNISVCIEGYAKLRKQNFRMHLENFFLVSFVNFFFQTLTVSLAQIQKVPTSQVQ